MRGSSGAAPPQRAASTRKRAFKVSSSQAKKHSSDTSGAKVAGAQVEDESWTNIEDDKLRELVADYQRRGEPPEWGRIAEWPEFSLRPRMTHELEVT